MRKLTTVALIVVSLSLAASSASFAATQPSPKTKSTATREDQTPRDVIDRVLKFIKAHLPSLQPTDAAPLPTIPTP